VLCNGYSPWTGHSQNAGPDSAVTLSSYAPFSVMSPPWAYMWQYSQSKIRWLLLHAMEHVTSLQWACFKCHSSIICRNFHRQKIFFKPNLQEITKLNLRKWQRFCSVHDSGNFKPPQYQVKDSWSRVSIIRRITEYNWGADGVLHGLHKSSSEALL
jgi:hypothetical protein